MNEINLRTVDLNLLAVFKAIYDFGQVTEAAETLGRTQPAVPCGSAFRPKPGGFMPGNL